MKQKTYFEKLKDPRWQRRRLEILQRDNWTCQRCHENEITLHVHHRWYENGEPWETSDESLVTLCEACHEEETVNSTEKFLLRGLISHGCSYSDLKWMGDVLSVTPAKTELPIDSESEHKATLLCHLLGTFTYFSYSNV